MKLKQSKVRFLEDGHKYFLELDELTGVTTILHKVLFPNKYSGIDEETLRKAAQRGTDIHEAIQDYELDRKAREHEFLYDCEQCLVEWLKKAPKRTTIRDEYLVSNDIDIASKVDLVQVDKDNRITLADIKTTTTFDAEYLSWQLSMYAYMFERMNKTLKVNRLVAYWFKRTGFEWNLSIVDVERKSDEQIEQLIEWWRNGEVHETALVEDKPEFAPPMPIVDVASVYADIDKQIEELSTKREEFRTRLMELMIQNNIEKFELDGGRMKVARIMATTRKSFDSARFREEHRELYDEYQRESIVKETIKITIK